MPQALVNRIVLPETYAGGVPYGLPRELRAGAPVWWVDEPAVGAWAAVLKRPVSLTFNQSPGSTSA
jgi:hypothetical protein